jgi:flagellar assembly factor FliW
MKVQEQEFLIDPQPVRLLDVFVVAPFLFYTAYKFDLPKPVKMGLYVLSVSTLVYNGYNYLKNS